MEKHPGLESIRDWRRISATLATAGQPTREQFLTLADSGFRTVINLALSNSPQALRDQAEICTSLGMEYLSIPVDFQLPRIADFEEFISVMQRNPTPQILVHCARNYRASAFVYLWRTLVQNEREEAALADMKAIWTPDVDWGSFILDVQRHFASRHHQAQR